MKARKYSNFDFTTEGYRLCKSWHYPRSWQPSDKHGSIYQGELAQCRIP